MMMKMLSADTRTEGIARLKRESFDVLIVGGGINGAGLARDLALRAETAGSRIRVALIDRAQFGSGTSSRNSQLIHGGLRYLRHFDFGLVREALHERATLLELAPDYVKPLPFLLPVYSWFDRLQYGVGLSLYDLLAGSKGLKRHRWFSPAEAGAAEPAMDHSRLRCAAEFWDGQVHSARLVLANVNDAVRHGAVAVNYVELAGDSRLRDTLSGETWDVRFKLVVDATGAWSRRTEPRLVRGSHIVVPRVHAGTRAIAHFEQGRIVFMIPWGSRQDLTLIGTTDEEHTSGPDKVRITAREVSYLRRVASHVFPQAASAPILGAFSSLRPLLREASASATSNTRSHRIGLNGGVLAITGGKYTTYRLMAEEAADIALQSFRSPAAALHPTREAPLPHHPAPADPAEAARTDMAQKLRDYLCVSTYAGYERRWTVEELRLLAGSMAAPLGWTEARIEAEAAEALTVLSFEEA